MVGSYNVFHLFLARLYKLKKLNSFPSHKDLQAGAHLCFCSPQPDTSRSCKSMASVLHRVPV